jgi:hypothetical protein
MGTDLQIANVERAPLKLQSHQVERERERERGLHAVFLKFNFVK